MDDSRTPPVRATSEDQFVESIAAEAGGLGVEMASIHGALEDLDAQARRQSSRLDAISATMAGLVDGNREIEAAASATATLSASTRDTLRLTLRDTERLAASAVRVSRAVHDIGPVLAQVSGAVSDIESITYQIKLVAFNASVEAHRAGDAGRSFGVIASAVRDLSERVERSSSLIATTLADLSARIASLEAQVQRDNAGMDDIEAAVQQATRSFDRSFDSVAAQVDQICTAARAGMSASASARSEIDAIAGQSRESMAALSAASTRASGLLTLGERLIELTADSGFVTPDTPYIEQAMAVADRISAAFESALVQRRITLDELFDARYRIVPGSDPQQVTTAFTRLTDELLPAIQEPVLAALPQVVFCAAVDRNGYLPTHNRKFSQPQGRDPVWNAANCRNRRLFRDRTGLSAGQNSKRFLLQTYRRDMGGGEFVIMKDVSAPIRVRGRHWGGLRIAYRLD